MTVLQLKQLINDLPDHMHVVMPQAGGDIYVTACYTQSEVEDMPVEDDQAEEGYTIVQLFIIRPCSCDVDLPVIPEQQIMN